METQIDKCGAASKPKLKTKVFLVCIVFVLSLFVYGIFELHHYFNVRLYNVVGLQILPGNQYSLVVGLLGEPDRIESIQTVSTNPVYHYEFHYDNLGLLFRINQLGHVVFFDVKSEDYRLRGRDRLRVGSNRDDVERAIARPTSSRLSQNFWVSRRENTILLEIDKWVDVVFNFDENDVLYRIRISLWG